MKAFCASLALVVVIAAVLGGEQPNSNNSKTAFWKLFDEYFWKFYRYLRPRRHLVLKATMDILTFFVLAWSTYVGY